MTDRRLSSLAMLSIENGCARSLDYDNVITTFANKKGRSRLFKWYCVFINFSCFSVSLLSFRSVCINVLLNSGIGAEFFMTWTFGIGMLYSNIRLFTYVQIVVYFLNAAFQFYTSKVIWPVSRGSCAYFWGGGRSWSATALPGPPQLGGLGGGCYVSASQSLFYSESDYWFIRFFSFFCIFILQGLTEGTISYELKWNRHTWKRVDFLLRIKHRSETKKFRYR